MNVEELKVGARVLVQSDRSTKEHAKIKAILDNDKILLQLSDGYIKEFDGEYVLKNFGQES